MIFNNYHIEFNPNQTIDLISSYKNIRIKFILNYIKKKKFDYIKNDELCKDAILYSKYYLYWKIYECVYSENVMNLLFDIEFLEN